MAGREREPRVAEIRDNPGVGWIDDDVPSGDLVGIDGVEPVTERHLRAHDLEGEDAVGRVHRDCVSRRKLVNPFERRTVGRAVTCDGAVAGETGSWRTAVMAGADLERLPVDISHHELVEFDRWDLQSGEGIAVLRKASASQFGRDTAGQVEFDIHHHLVRYGRCTGGGRRTLDELERGPELLLHRRFLAAGTPELPGGEGEYAECPERTEHPEACCGSGRQTAPTARTARAHTRCSLRPPMVKTAAAPNNTKASSR